MLEASFLFSHVGQDTPLCSQSYLLLVITIPLTPTQSQMVLTVCQAIHIPDQTLMESSRGSVVGPRLQMRKPRLTKKRPGQAAKLVSGGKYAEREEPLVVRTCASAPDRCGFESWLRLFSYRL